MEPHNCICTQDDRIRDLTARVDRMEERLLNTNKMLEDIKEFQGWLMKGALVTAASSIGTLLLLIFKMKGVG